MASPAEQVTGPVLVAGAGGFVGSHIVRELVRRGLAVTALVHARAERLDDVTPVKMVEADLTRSDTATKIVAQARPAVVINAAGYGVAPSEKDRATMFAVNVAAAQALHEAARAHRVRRFIQLGSVSEYGDNPEPLDEDSPLAPKDFYGATKAAATLLVAGSRGDGTEAVVLRLFNIWGAGENPHRLVPNTIRHCRENKPFALTAGTQVKDYGYAPDVARWIADLALRPEAIPFPVVNLASGRRLAVRELATAVARLLQGEHLLQFGAKPMPAGEVQTGPADTARVDSLIARRFTPLDDAVRAVVQAS